MTPEEFDLVAAHAALAAWQLHIRETRPDQSARAELAVGPGFYRIAYLVTIGQEEGATVAAVGEAPTAVEAVRKAIIRHTERLVASCARVVEDRPDPTACIQ